MKTQSVKQIGTGLESTHNEEKTMSHKSNLAIKGVILCLSFLQLFGALQAVAGPIATGGGNVESNRIKDVVKMLGVTNDGDSILKKQLIGMVKFIQAIPPTNEAGLQIISMAENGLIEDIQKSRYVLKKYCEEDGVEKSASTQKINLALDPSQEHPDICINVMKLATESAQLKEIMGALMHEHARHFGLEDTDELGMHPTALAVTTWYEQLLQFNDEVSPDFAVGLTQETDEARVRRGAAYYEVTIRNDVISIATTEPAKIKFEVKNFQGSCNEGSLFTHYFQYKLSSGKIITGFNHSTPLDFKSTTIASSRFDVYKNLIQAAKISASRWRFLRGTDYPSDCVATIEIKYDDEIRFVKTIKLAENEILIKVVPFKYPQE